jgi:hypothetical protein
MMKPPPGMLEEEEEEPVGMMEEEEPPPTSLWSHPMKPPPGARAEVQCGGSLREKRTSRSSLGPASSQAPNAC